MQKILDRGVRFVYSSPYGRPDNLKDHPNLIWLDLPWRPDYNALVYVLARRLGASEETGVLAALVARQRDLRHRAREHDDVADGNDEQNVRG